MTTHDLDDVALAVSPSTPGLPGSAGVAGVELAMLEALARNGIDLAVAVPCKYIARLIVETERDPRFTLLYPSREEEGLGIVAGAALARRAPSCSSRTRGWATW